MVVREFVVVAGEKKCNRNIPRVQYLGVHRTCGSSPKGSGIGELKLESNEGPVAEG